MRQIDRDPGRSDRSDDLDLSPDTRIATNTDGVTQAYDARGGRSTDQVRSVVAEPGHFEDLLPAVDAHFEEPRRDDIAALESPTVRPAPQPS